MSQKHRGGLLLSLLLIALSGCKTEEVAPRKLDIDLAGHVSLTGLYGDSVVYQNIEQEKITFYSFDIQTNQVQKLGFVSDYMLNGKWQVCIDDRIYTYIATTNPDENDLYSIDYKQNMVRHVATNEANSMLTPIAALNNEILSLRINGDEESNTRLTEITKTSPKFGAEEVLMSIDFDYNRMEGAGAENIACYQDEVYLIWDYPVDQDFDSTIHVYDQNMNFLRQIDVQQIHDLFEGYITDFLVMGKYAYLNNISHQSVIAQLESDRLTPILETEQLKLVEKPRYNPKDGYLFFKHRTNDFYYLDVKKNKLYQGTYCVDEENAVLSAAADKDGLVLRVADPEGDREEEFMYYASYLSVVDAIQSNGQLIWNGVST